MVWLRFGVSAFIIVIAAIKLAQYGDTIAEQTGLGGMFIGTLLVALGTSLPEVITAINSIRQGVPNLTAGDLFGSCMFNMLLLAVLDVIFRQTRILRRVALTHALTAALAVSLIGLTVLFILADLDWQLGWIGVDSLVVVAVYIGGVRLIQLEGRRSGSMPAPQVAPRASFREIWRPLLGFSIATAIMVVVVPHMVAAAAEIAQITGLGTGFIGVIMVAVVTSLPELVSTVAAVRLGAFDLAVGNLFGSNVFNMFALAFVDSFYAHGRLLGAIDPQFALAGLVALLLTSLGLIGNLARLERRILFIELDALLLMVGYFAGLWLLYTRGIGH